MGQNPEDWMRAQKRNATAPVTEEKMPLQKQK